MTKPDPVVARLRRLCELRRKIEPRVPLIDGLIPIRLDDVEHLLRLIPGTAPDSGQQKEGKSWAVTHTTTDAGSAGFGLGDSALPAEGDALNARRYRWLRDSGINAPTGPWAVLGTNFYDAIPLLGTGLDAAIDAQLAKGEKT